MRATHSYTATVTWTGDLGTGTSDYRSFARDHEITSPGKTAVLGSADPAFRGDAARWNPEELLVASLAQCHMLWFLHLAASAGVVVTHYVDTPTGEMVENDDGSGQFSCVVLRPEVTVLSQQVLELVPGLHERAHAMCFIARSVSFPVRHDARTHVA